MDTIEDGVSRTEKGSEALAELDTDKGSDAAKIIISKQNERIAQLEHQMMEMRNYMSNLKQTSAVVPPPEESGAAEALSATGVVAVKNPSASGEREEGKANMILKPEFAIEVEDDLVLATLPSEQGSDDKLIVEQDGEDELCEGQIEEYIPGTHLAASQPPLEIPPGVDKTVYDLMMIAYRRGQDESSTKERLPSSKGPTSSADTTDYALAQQRGKRSNRKAGNRVKGSDNGQSGLMHVIDTSERRSGRAPKEHQYNKVINRQITSMAETGDTNQLLDVIEMYLPDMNGLNLTTALHRVAKISSSEMPEQWKLQTINHPVFKRLYDAVVEHIKNHKLSRVGAERRIDRVEKTDGWEMPVQCMSIVTWSCATLRLRDKMLFSTIASIVTPRLQDLQSFELSNLLWGYAKVSLVPVDLFNSAGERLFTRKHGEFKAQCLSTIAWAFATAERRDSGVFRTLADEIKSNAANLKTQEISNSLWAFAKIRYVDTDLFNALALTAITNSKIWMFKSQELSNTVWAFAKVGLQHVALFNKVEAATIQKRHDMVPQNIANILWAYAKMQVPCRTNMFQALLEVAAARLCRYKRQELSTVIWAASEVCPTSEAFFSVAARVCGQRLKEFAPIALANLVKDLSAVEISSPELLQGILQESIQRLPQYEPSALCILLRGILAAKANPRFDIPGLSEELSKATATIGKNLAPRINRLRPSELQDVADALWMQGRISGQPINASSEVEALKHLVQKAIADRATEWEQEHPAQDQDEDFTMNGNGFGDSDCDSDSGSTKLPERSNQFPSMGGANPWPSGVLVPDPAWNTAWSSKESIKQGEDNPWSLQQGDEEGTWPSPTIDQFTATASSTGDYFSGSYDLPGHLTHEAEQWAQGPSGKPLLRSFNVKGCQGMDLPAFPLSGRLTVFGERHVTQNNLCIRMKQRLLCWTRDPVDLVDITNGETVFSCRGRTALSIAEKKTVYDAAGAPVLCIKEKSMRLGDAQTVCGMKLDGKPGKELFKVSPTMSKKGQTTSNLKNANGKAIQLTGNMNLADKSGCIFYEEKPVGLILDPSPWKRFLKNGWENDDYVLEIAQGVDAALIVGMVVAFDEVNQSLNRNVAGAQSSAAGINSSHFSQQGLGRQEPAVICPDMPPWVGEAEDDLGLVTALPDPGEEFRIESVEVPVSVAAFPEALLAEAQMDDLRQPRPVGGKEFRRDPVDDVWRTYDQVVQCYASEYSQDQIDLYWEYMKESLRQEQMMSLSF